MKLIHQCVGWNFSSGIRTQIIPFVVNISYLFVKGMFAHGVSSLLITD
jgi:hypothetical protein